MYPFGPPVYKSKGDMSPHSYRCAALALFNLPDIQRNVGLPNTD